MNLGLTVGELRALLRFRLLTGLNWKKMWAPLFWVGFIRTQSVWSQVKEGSPTNNFRVSGTRYKLNLLNWYLFDLGDHGDRFTLQLMAAASKFQLSQLVDKCEQQLVSSVSVANCIRFYATAHEIKASKLAEHCSQLISSNWEKFSYQDFESLSAELVYQMLKSKAKYPLHSAIRLKREDVVFLYLIGKRCMIASNNNGRWCQNMTFD